MGYSQNLADVYGQIAERGGDTLEAAAALFELGHYYLHGEFSHSIHTSSAENLRESSYLYILQALLR
jgi:hypothetical protein